MASVTRSVATLMIAAALGAGGLAIGTASAQTTIKIAHPNVPDHPMGQGFE